MRDVARPHRVREEGVELGVRGCREVQHELVVARDRGGVAHLGPRAQLLPERLDAVRGHLHPEH